MFQRRDGIRRPPTGAGGLGAAGRIFLEGHWRRRNIKRGSKASDRLLSSTLSSYLNSKSTSTAKIAHSGNFKELVSLTAIVMEFRKYSSLFDSVA
jgi:hypothetical protein